MNNYNYENYWKFVFEFWIIYYTNKMYAFTGWHKDYEIVSDFDWNSYKDLIIKDVTIDDNDITIYYENTGLVLSISKGDCRYLSDMDTSICDADPEGCCFEHSGCGYEKCLEHYPLQNVTFECDTKSLIGKNVINFTFDSDGYDPNFHEFFFILSDGNKVSLTITNNIATYYVEVILDIFY
jgi:hypothetical protein